MVQSDSPPITSAAKWLVDTSIRFGQKPVNKSKVKDTDLRLMFIRDQAAVLVYRLDEPVEEHEANMVRAGVQQALIQAHPSISFQVDLEGPIERPQQSGRVAIGYRVTWQRIEVGRLI